MLRIALHGELDVVVADRLAAQLRELTSDRVRVRLDLSGLVFIDSCGIRTLIEAVENGSQDGDRLVEVVPSVSRAVQAKIDLVGAERLLWATSDRGQGDPWRGDAPWSR